MTRLTSAGPPVGGVEGGLPWRGPEPPLRRQEPPLPPPRLHQCLELRPWVLSFDPSRTEEAYARLDTSGAERCGCDGCFNFALARHLVFPTALIDLFEWLGIDPVLESEVVYRGALGDGHHAYSGWFHLVGRIEAGPRANQGRHGSIQSRHLVPLDEGVSVAFSSDTRLAPDVFDGLPVVELEVELDVPWVADLPEPA